MANVETEEKVENSPEPDDWEYAGLEVIDRACIEVYPDQPNPLQATAAIKFWLGGPDPLDYISMYSNSGDPDRGVPPHWHYVTYGFSDLHGDGRVHPVDRFCGSDQPSGYGFELTLRIKKKESEATPPMWPARIMNQLANYVFQTGNSLHIGDHIPWHRPFDDTEDSGSKIQHILVTKDPQLPDLSGPYGTIDFRQLVGVTEDEMKAAQKWKGLGVLELMADTREVGPFYITDLDRPKSIFEADSNLMQQVNDGINADGSNLGHVTAVCLWTDINASLSSPSDAEKEFIENEEPETLEGVHLMFDSEAADLLPMVIRGRLQKGKLFVFQNAESHAIQLVPPGYHDNGIFVNQTEPLKAQGGFLQIYCSHSLLEKMCEEFDCLSDSVQEHQYPQEFRFSDPTILTTVSPRGQILGADPALL